MSNARPFLLEHANEELTLVSFFYRVFYSLFTETSETDLQVWGMSTEEETRWRMSEQGKQNLLLERWGACNHIT